MNIGDIFLIENRDITPPKKKFSVCVCISEKLFLLINSENRALYKCIPIKKSEHDFLKQDSFISCLRPFVYSEEQIKTAQKCGHLSFKELTVLVRHLKENSFFPEKEKIIREITDFLNS